MFKIEKSADEESSEIVVSEKTDAKLSRWQLKRSSVFIISSIVNAPKSRLNYDGHQY